MLTDLSGRSSVLLLPQLDSHKGRCMFSFKLTLFYKDNSPQTIINTKVQFQWQTYKGTFFSLITASELLQKEKKVKETEFK